MLQMWVETGEIFWKQTVWRTRRRACWFDRSHEFWCTTVLETLLRSANMSITSIRLWFDIYVFESLQAEIIMDIMAEQQAASGEFEGRNPMSGTIGIVWFVHWEYWVDLCAQWASRCFVGSMFSEHCHQWLYEAPRWTTIQFGSTSHTHTFTIDISVSWYI